MNLNIALIFGLLLEFFITVVAAGGYFFYYVKMPEYSINQARKAVQEGNLHEFEKYVDVSRLLKDGVTDAAMYVPQGQSGVHSMIKSGQMTSVLKMGLEEYIKSGKWGEIQGLSDPQAKELVEQCGLMTFTFRGVEYIHKGVDPLVVPKEQIGEVEINDVGAIDKALDTVDKAVIKVEKFLGVVDDVQTGLEELQKGNLPTELVKNKQLVDEDGNEYTGEVAEAGIAIYEPSLGDVMIMRVKLQETTDGNWRAVDIANYGELLERLLNMHQRDMKKYVNRVNDVLIETDQEMAAYRKSHPKTDKDWVMRVTEIVKTSNEKIEQIDVPRGGEELAELLKERKTVFFSMMDVYYESNEKRKARNIDAKLEQATREWTENRDKINKIIDKYKNLNL